MWLQIPAEHSLLQWAERTPASGGDRKEISACGDEILTRNMAALGYGGNSRQRGVINIEVELVFMCMHREDSIKPDAMHPSGSGCLCVLLVDSQSEQLRDVVEQSLVHDGMARESISHSRARHVDR